jgi:putative transposase
MAELQKRKHPRLKEYDYSQDGGYFLTICTYQRKCMLSKIVGRGLAPAEPLLLPAGQIVAEELETLPERFPTLELLQTVIMPNHIHILLRLSAAGASPRPTMGQAAVTDVVRVLKSLTARQWNGRNGTRGVPLWQGSYHDHILRDENDFLNHWTYIAQNPARWGEDEYYLYVCEEE